MRLVVGDRSINEVISKREEIAAQAQVLLQKELDEAETGISVSTVEMKRTNVPEAVQPSFNEVNQAVQEKEKMIYQAARSTTSAFLRQEATRKRRFGRRKGMPWTGSTGRKGDASRFLSLYEEYAKAEDVTRRRIYLEAIREILPKMGDKYIVDADQRNLLPLLNLVRTERRAAVKSKGLLVILALVVFAVFSSAYVVDETEQVVLTQFGRAVGEAKDHAGPLFQDPGDSAGQLLFQKSSVMGWRSRAGSHPG